MSSSDDFTQGAPGGRGVGHASPAPRRTSNAFGSPGTDSTVKRIDLNDELIKHPEATFLMRAAGNAMMGVGIADGDVLLVDRAVKAAHGTVVIAVVEGELLCRRLEQPAGVRGGQVKVRLVADVGVAAIDISADTPLEVWGVVTTVIKRLA